MLNQIVLIGRMTKEPEIKTVGENPISVVKFLLAVNRAKYGDTEPQADFIPVTAWRSTAEFIGRNFHKGKQVYVVGRLRTYTWEKDGVKHYDFEVVANEVGFADAPQKGGQAKGNVNTSNSDDGFLGNDFSGFGGDFDDDNLPF